VHRPQPGSVLDRATLNRTLLARQGLLVREAPTASEMVERLVGMQAQVPRDPYVGLWARIRAFDPAELEGLLVDRAAVRMTLMRATIHLATTRDALLLRAATLAVTERGFMASPFRRRVAGLDLDALRRAGVALVEQRPLTMSELGRALGERWPGQDTEAMAYAVRYLEPMVQVTPRGLLRRSSAPRLTTLTCWLGRGGGGDGPMGSRARPAAEIVDGVVERYLRAFGPATTSDIRTWSGMGSVRDSVARLRPRLHAYRDASGRELVDVADGVFADPDQAAPVRFLGEYDNVFLAHADRSRITGDLAWGPAWGRRGTFFADGYLAGAWRIPDRGGPTRIELEAMRSLTAETRAEAAAEADELVRFLTGRRGDPEVSWVS
jgi:hypothetical protein